MSTMLEARRNDIHRDDARGSLRRNGVRLSAIRKIDSREPTADSPNFWTGAPTSIALLPMRKVARIAGKNRVPRHPAAV
jgi:hypothetical protein